MQLRKVGTSFNNISKEMAAAYPSLKPKEKAVFKLLDGVYDEGLKQTLFGSYRGWPCRDTVLDIGTNEFVEIGIPRIVKENEVRSVKRFVLDGGGSHGMVGEFFTLNGDNHDHQMFYQYLVMSNRCESNPHRNKAVLAEYTIVDTSKEREKRLEKRNSLREALNTVGNMSTNEIINTAASLGWNPKKDVEELLDDVSEYARNFPEEFIKGYKDKDGTNRKAQLKKAEVENVIAYNPMTMEYRWAKSGITIATLSKKEGKNEIELLDEFLYTFSNGNEIRKNIDNQLASAVSTYKVQEKPAKKVKEKEPAAAETGADFENL